MDEVPITNRLNRQKPWRLVLLALTGLLFLMVLVCEIMGWPFLAKPAQRFLAEKLQRAVVLTSPTDEDPDFRLRLVGGVRLALKHLELGAPDWSVAPFMIQADNLSLKLRYRDLLAWRNNPENILRIDSLQADVMNGHLERREDGRASWQFRKDKPDKEPGNLPDFGFLAVKSGRVIYHDEPLDLKLDALIFLKEGELEADALEIKATGRYQAQDLNVKLASSGLLPWVAENMEPIPVSLNVTLGGAKLAFKGQSTDALKLQKLSGNFVLSGTSLGAVGDALGLTLPNTPPFRTEGSLQRDIGKWSVSVTSAKVGSSSLKGDFVYEAEKGKKLLTGVLEGSSLVLADLAPSVGAADDSTADTDRPPGRVLPAKQFDLPSLRAMDASVRINLENLDLGSEFLKPLQPVRAHIGLAEGVLRISELNASTAQGHLEGTVMLDARGDVALWEANLKWDLIQLEQWIRVPRAGDQPPYITGSMKGGARLQGKGRSTAEILGSMSGSARNQVQDGTISHLLIEAAGLDAAEALGVWFRGDDVLKMRCAVAELRIKEGLVEPGVFVIDTQDSAVWLNGRLSMKTEVLDLQLVVTPKDFSPVSLRTPLLITGTLGDPDVSIAKGPLVGKVAGAALLSLLNPFAALLPFLDSGTEDSKEDSGRSGCFNLAERAKTQRAKAQ